MQNSSPFLGIFRTKTQERLLVELFLQSDRPRTLSALARSLGVDQTTVMREANRLIDAGLVIEERVGRARTIAADERSPLAEPLRALLRLAHGSPEAERPHRPLRPGHRHRQPSDRRPLPSMRRRV